MSRQRPEFFGFLNTAAVKARALTTRRAFTMADWEDVQQEFLIQPPLEFIELTGAYWCGRWCR
jgi:hypothetical protein